MSQSSNTSSSSNSPNARKKLSLMDLVLSGLCIMAPIAPFVTYYSVADAGLGMVAMIYFIGTLAMLTIAYSFAQLSKEFPVSGSAYSYVQKSMNPHIGFLTGWANLCVYMVLPSFMYVVAGGWLSELVPSVPLFVWVAIFAIVNIAVNIMGVSVATKINTIMFWLQMLLILTFIIFAIKAVFIDGVGQGGFSLKPFYMKDSFSIQTIMAGISIAIVNFVGFDTIGVLADDAENPKKNIGKAAILSITIVGVLFLIQAYMGSLIELDYKHLNENTALFDVAQQIGGHNLFLILLVACIFSFGLTVPINMQSAVAKIVNNMAKENLLPYSKPLTKESKKFGTPTTAIFLVNGLTVIFALTLSFGLLVSSIDFCAILVYLALNMAVIYHFNITKKLKGFKNRVKYVVMPVLGIIISLIVEFSFDKKAVLLAGALMLIGVLIGAFKSNFYRKEISISDME